MTVCVWVLAVASLSYTLVLSGEAKEDEQTMVLK
jgi:hypothetical protein